VKREDLNTAVARASVVELPGLIGDFEAAKAAAWARLVEGPAPQSLTEAPDRNVSAAEAARRLGMSRDWLYRNAAKLPFTVKIGRRVLFSARGLERWNRNGATR